MSTNILLVLLIREQDLFRCRLRYSYAKEQIGRDVEEFGQRLRLYLADRAHAVDGLRRPAARSEYMYDVLLSQAARLHQVLQYFVWGRWLNRIMFVLVFFDQRRQQVKQMLVFRRNAVALLEQLFDLFNCVVVFFFGTNHSRN